MTSDAPARACLAPHTPTPQDLIQAGREMVARRFKEAGVADDVLGMISHEFVITPPEWVQRYNLKHGAVFGLSHGVFQLACFRPPVQSGLPGWPDSPKVENLYFVGASTRPGALLQRGREVSPRLDAAPQTQSLVPSPGTLGAWTWPDSWLSAGAPPQATACRSS